MAEQTVADLARESRRAARALLALGIQKGDPVFVMLPRVPAWYAAMLGAIRIGAVPMPGTNQLTSRDIAYRFRSADAVAAITDAAGAEKIDAIEEPTCRRLRHRIAWGGGTDGWDDLDALMDAAGDGETPTSPTARGMTRCSSTSPAAPSATRRWCCSPAPTGSGTSGPHGSGTTCAPATATGRSPTRAGRRRPGAGLFGQWHERATVVQVALGKPDADTILSILRRARITSFCAPPTLYRLLVQADLAEYDLPDLRHCTSAGEPLNPEVIRAWRDATGADGLRRLRPDRDDRACRQLPRGAGPARARWASRCRATTSTSSTTTAGPRADDVVGNIAVRYEPVRPVGLFDGYHRDPEATARRSATAGTTPATRRWRDADGYFWFEGRDDDVITSSAYRIGPFEVESALLEHPAVAEAAVVGKDDPERTQIVTAFVVLAAGHEPGDELARELQDHTKRPDRPVQVPARDPLRRPSCRRP